MSLFDRLKQYLQIIGHGDKQAVARNILHFPPKQINGAGRVLFDNLQIGGRAIFIVPGRSGWKPESEYFEAARDAAKRGISITRVFLLPHPHYISEPLLYRHWELDKSSGIKVEFALTSQHLEKDIGFPLSPGTLDLGIWDGEMVCSIIYNREVGVQAQADEWIVSRRPEDIEAANKNWIFIDKLPRLTFSPAEVQDDNAFEKLLLQTAPLAAMLADFLCKGDHIDAKECRWYHRIWQYLSIMDLVSSPRRHTKFYLEELPVNLFNKQESARILVSGTADYAILVYLLRAFKGRILPKITVLDMCQTPLHLCRWYGVQQGVQIETLVQNILDLERPESFDLITTHDFLTIFDGEDRLRILKKWYSLLVSGGRVVTTIRIEEDGTSNQKVTATSNQIKEFMQRATQLTKLWYEFVLPRPDPDWIVHGARIYAEKISSWPFHDSQEILSLFSDAGFKIAKFDPIESQVEMKLVTFIQLVAYK